MMAFIPRWLEFLYKFRREHPRKSLFAMVVLFMWTFSKIKQLRKRPKSLKGKVVVITGGVSGIGRLTALLLKLQGSVVIVWDVNEDGIREMAELVDEAMKVDITSTAQVQAAAQTVTAQYGRVDVLINNAGIVIGKPLLQLKNRQIQKCFEVNAIAHFWTVKAFLPQMIKRKSGHIVTISSCAGIQGVSRLVDYSASKAACRIFHDTLAVELEEQGMAEGISMSCINPCFINTGMFDGTVCCKWWWARKYLGFDFLEPEFVASEIIRAIQYEIPELVLPDSMRKIFLFNMLFVPTWLHRRGLAISGCTVGTH